METDSQYMWNDGKHLLWQHIAPMYLMNAEILLKVLPKITYNTSVLPHIQS